MIFISACAHLLLAVVVFSFIYLSWQSRSN